MLSPGGTNVSGWYELLGGAGSSQRGSASNLQLKGCTDKPLNFSQKLPGHQTPEMLHSPNLQPIRPAQEGTGAHPPLGWSLTVARSFCVRPLLCLPCWITLPTSRETLSWCSSSVSRSSLAVFFVMKCCLFWPAAPAVRSSNKRTTKDKQNKAQSSAKKYERMFSKPSAAQDTRELSGFQHTNINIDLTQI